MQSVKLKWLKDGFARYRGQIEIHRYDHPAAVEKVDGWVSRGLCEILPEDYKPPHPGPISSQSFVTQEAESPENRAVTETKKRKRKVKVEESEGD